jgi:creatinine amidohydrolase/Fe(II)-dependent formamide hydrolase-like protein
LIGAQVAINYGLFCREIRFEGELDDTDRKFLAAMMENTAREIFVKKFLEPNPFLVGDASRMAPVRPRSYLQAGLAVADPASRAVGEGAPDTRGAWRARAAAPAILSSGGKDSLLTYGLLQELGWEPHPIFVNESGRHWYTALNAYRHLKKTCKFTTRVWSDCDRMFTWMLGHLPFVDPGFARRRADEYPIRLWTVAVFLFGALPILKSRGLDGLLIGDEFDTTRRTSAHGITHYDGLFDQSRYFDDALTRFYRRKKWPLSQFSVLRPLSELLIQKILVDRYPKLQRQQVSCHATHLEGERVKPCGRCEKCRRIVSMLVALDADPKRCGYTTEQVTSCLDGVATGGVHQETDGVRHLGWMLAQKGILKSDRVGTIRTRETPEVLKLRFDPERSPVHAIPGYLRESLYPVYLQHADGAVRRHGRRWQAFDLMTDPEIALPYPFEPPAGMRGQMDAGRKQRKREAPNSDGYLLAEMTWPQAKSRLAETDLALLPVGAVEQHGPHLPLDTDAWDADYLARKVAEGCSPPRPLVLPLISYGVSYHHEDFSGTLSVSPEVLSRVVYEIGMNAARQGIAKLIVVNGHGGNVPALQFAAQMINRDAHIFTCVESGESSDADIVSITETPNDVHAGEIETSTSLATRPGLVEMGQARRFVPRFSNQYLDFTSARSVEWYARTAKISRSGVLGDPTKASAEKGKRYWEMMITHLVAFVESLKGLSLNEIYERRY